MKLIVGLGNPGRLYVNNRHNVGFQCVDLVARRHGIRLDRRRARSKIGVGEVAGTPVVLAKPTTFMNLSGEAVSALMRLHKVALEDLVVIYDDLDLPLGRLRVRPGGSAGGHNGMKSIIGHLGTPDFARLRIGIGPPVITADTPSRSVDTVDYVLSDFTSDEKAVLHEVCQTAADAVGCLISQGVTAAMNRYN